MESYTIHPAADCFPMMDDVSYRNFRLDIEANGQLESIKIYDDQILDGRNRHRACIELGIPPLFQELTIEDPVAYVISTNLQRRHLSTRQRSACAAELANLEMGSNQKIEKQGTQNCAPSMSVTEAAEALNVSPRSVTNAKKVMNTDPQAHADAKAGIKKPTKVRVLRPSKFGWKDAVMDRIGYLGITREKLQRYGNRDGIRGDVEARLGYKIPQMITETQADEIAVVVAQCIDLDAETTAKLKAEADEIFEQLSEKDQRKVERSVARYRKEIDFLVSQRVELELAKILPMYRRDSAEHKRAVAAYSGVLSEMDYKRLLSCLHPDKSPDPERQAALFSIIKEKKFEFCGHTKTEGSGTLPETVADLMAMRRVK